MFQILFLSGTIWQNSMFGFSPSEELAMLPAPFLRLQGCRVAVLVLRQSYSIAVDSGSHTAQVSFRRALWLRITLNF